MTLPISVSFLCCHCFKHFSKSLVLGSKFAWNTFSLLVPKVIPSERASVELHINFLSFKYTTLQLVMLPIRRTWHFLALIFNPEIQLKLSKMSISVWNDLLSTQSRSATLLFSLIARRWVGLQTLWWFRLKDLSFDEMVGAWCFSCLLGQTRVNLLDFFCSGFQFYLLLSPFLCFISLLYLDLCFWRWCIDK